MSFFTSTYGGGRHHTAIIGHAPESREWHPGDPAFYPEVDWTARVEAFVTIDSGLWAPTRIGARTWLMKHSHVGHDAVIGDDCELSPGVVIGGHAQVGNNVRLGIGALVRPFVKIGDNARIGMGAVVVKDVPANELWYGNPARMHEWPADSQPDYQTDRDERYAAGHSREFARSIGRLNGSVS